MQRKKCMRANTTRPQRQQCESVHSGISAQSGTRPEQALQPKSQHIASHPVSASTRAQHLQPTSLQGNMKPPDNRHTMVQWTTESMAARSTCIVAHISDNQVMVCTDTRTPVSPMAQTQITIRRECTRTTMRTTICASWDINTVMRCLSEEWNQPSYATNRIDW